jgi:hypothetical protein
VRTTLKPDALAVVQLDGYEDHWFLEVDQATESAATIGRKLTAYAVLLLRPRRHP